MPSWPWPYKTKNTEEDIFIYFFYRSVSDKESWDTPYRWRDVKEDCSKDDDYGKHSQDNFTNLEFHRDPDEPIPELPELLQNDKSVSSKPKHRIQNTPDYGKVYSNKLNKQFDNKFKYNTEKSNSFNLNELNKVEPRDILYEVNSRVGETPFQNVQLRKVEPKKDGIETFNANSSPANKDFEYIKAKPVSAKPKYAVDPIAELKNMPRNASTASDDEPPFNFQAMLRKTNIRRDSRDSIKNALQAVRRFSLAKNDDDATKNGLADDGPIKSKLVSLEISPGLFVEGHEVEL